jgi:kynurenine formamidase
MTDDGNGANWGRWGANDEAGAPNLIGPEQVLAGLALVTRGEVVSLAQPSGKEGAAPPHRRPGARFMDRDAGDYLGMERRTPDFRYAEDTVMFSTHSGTHMDALSHAWTGDRLYNGHPASSVRSGAGARKLGAEKLRSTLGRGVLIDLVHLNGGPLPASYPVSVADLEDGYRLAGTGPQPGDAVLLRTGWWEQHCATPEYFDNEPGVSSEAGLWLGENDAAYVGADNYAVEVQPSAPGERFPVHLSLLHGRGVPLIENMDLRELAARGVRTFLFVAAPVGFAGSTAAQINPLAVL